MKKRFSSIMALVLAASMALAGCGQSASSSGTTTPAGSTSTTAGATPAASATTSSGKDELVAGLSQLSTSIDPMVANQSNISSIGKHIYNTLVKYDENSELAGDMASEWTRPDDTTWVFTIKPGYKFHNGDDVTMDDIVFSIMRCKDIPQAMLYVPNVESVTAEGDKLTIKTAVKDNKLIHDLTSVVITSKKAVEAAGDGYTQIAVGSGPYKMTKFVASNEVVLERWDDHPTLKPKLRKITFRTMADATSRYMAIENGDADMIDGVGKNDRERAEKNDKLTSVPVSTLGVFFMAVNASKAPFDNAQVREALQYAIDKDGIMALGNGLDRKANTMISESLIAHSDKVVFPEYNLEKAKELLTAAGYPDGFKTTMWIYSDSQKSIAEYMQAVLKQINIEVTIEQLEFGKFLDSLDKGEHMMLFGKQTASPYAISSLNMYYSTDFFGNSGNFGFYTNQQALDLIKKGMETASPEEEVQYSQQIQEAVAKDNPYYPITYTVDCRVVNKQLKGYQFFADSSFSLIDAYFE